MERIQDLGIGIEAPKPNLLLLKTPQRQKHGEYYPKERHRDRSDRGGRFDVGLELWLHVLIARWLRSVYRVTRTSKRVIRAFGKQCR